MSDHGVVVSPVTHEGTLDYQARCECGWLVYAESQDVAHYEGSRHLDEVTP